MKRKMKLLGILVVSAIAILGYAETYSFRKLG